MTQARDLADLAGAATAGTITGRNLIINGAMNVAQRGTSAAGLTDGGEPYQTIDRFRFVEQGSPTYALTMSQSSTAPAGFANSLKLDITTAQGSLAVADALAVDTLIEAQNLQQLAYGTSSANTATLSFWVRSNKTGTYVVYFYQYDDDRATTHSYTINSADTWEYKTIVVPADTVGIIDNNNDRGIAVRWVLASGTNYTSGTASTAWAADVAANRYAGLNVNLADDTANEWYLTGAQLEVGSTATDFEHRSYGDELALCQRYFAVLQDTTAAYAGGFGFCNSTTKTKVCFPLGVALRANPTVNVTAATIDIRNNATNTAASSVSAAIAQGTNLYLDVNAASGLATNHACAIDPKQNMTFDAELDGYFKCKIYKC